MSPRARRKLDGRKIARAMGRRASATQLEAMAEAGGCMADEDPEPSPTAPATPALVSEPPCIFPVKGRYCGTCAPCFRRLYGPEWYLR